MRVHEHDRTTNPTALLLACLPTKRQGTPKKKMADSEPQGSVCILCIRIQEVPPTRNILSCWMLTIPWSKGELILTSKWRTRNVPVRTRKIGGRFGDSDVSCWMLNRTWSRVELISIEYMAYSERACCEKRKLRGGLLVILMSLRKKLVVVSRGHE